METLSRCVPRLAAASHSTPFWLSSHVAGARSCRDTMRKLLFSPAVYRPLYAAAEAYARPALTGALTGALTPAKPEPAACRLGARRFYSFPTSCRNNNNATLTPLPVVTFPFSGRPTTARARAPQHLSNTGARGHATCALATDDGHSGGNSSTLDTFTSNTTATTSANMADRNVLPDYFKPAHYDLVLTDLDFKNWSYNGSVTYEQLPRLVQCMHGPSASAYLYVISC